MHRAHRVRRFDASDAPLAAESGLTLPGAATTAIGALSPDGFFATWTRDATGGGTVEGLT